MKLNKKKVFALALVICLLATLSLGSLAWFTDQDSAKNDFYFTDSETSNPDDIFSVDVWEDNTKEDVEGEEKLDKIEFTSILPGDSLYKEVHIENTGHHDQYIRATVTITGARVWQEFYGAYVVPLNMMVANLTDFPIHTQISYYDAVRDTFVYELYLDKAIAAGEEIILFEEVPISTALTQKEAVALNGKFTIDVVAHAVQTRNVGDNVFEAFKITGAVKTVAVSEPEELVDALQNANVTRVVIANDMAASINYKVENKVLDFNGTNSSVKFWGDAEGANLVVCGIRDTDGATTSVQVNDKFTGEVVVYDCVMQSQTNAIKLGAGKITIDSCRIIGVDGAETPYGIVGNTNNNFKGDLVLNNTVLKNLNRGIYINQITGNLTMQGCALEKVTTPVHNTGGTTGTKTFTDNFRNGSPWPAA